MLDVVNGESRTFRAETLGRSSDLNGDVAFFRDLGFAVEEIFPADSPAVAVIAGHGIRFRLSGDGTPLSIRLTTNSVSSSGSVTSPGGTTVDIRPSPAAQVTPPLRSELVISRRDPADTPHAGRAGMRYRDLVPGRQGGCVIASLISIPVAGPVNDWVHFHEIRFQLIFVKSGWVRVVYEDQGEPFIMRAGDCVIQPPTIRHRVLENSDAMEVVEIGYPAEHVTRADPSMELPNRSVDSSRTWNGQSFIRHVDATARWTEVGTGVRRTNTGVDDATANLASVDVTEASRDATWVCDPVNVGTFVLLVTLAGSASVTVDDQAHHLDEGESIVVPVGSAYEVKHTSDGRVLRVIVDTTHD